LSGLDHYEVGVVEKNKLSSESPVFEQVDSPYQFRLQSSGEVRVTVRAFDKAGNSIDESVDINSSSDIITFLKQNLIAIILLLYLIIHFFFGHKVVSRVRRILKMAKEEEKKENFENKKKTELFPTNSSLSISPPLPPLEINLSGFEKVKFNLEEEPKNET